MPAAIIVLLEQLRTRVPTARVALQTFDYGGTALDVDIGARSFELFCGPFSGNGVSETYDTTPPFTAHDQYFETPESATAHFLSLILAAAEELQSASHAA